jgi:predicted O-methyltransferase YrrM
MFSGGVLNVVKQRVRSFLLDDLRQQVEKLHDEVQRAQPAAAQHESARPDPLSRLDKVWSGSGTDNMLLIAGMARAGRARRYLEIGAYRGFTAGFVKWANPDIEIHAIDSWQRANTSSQVLLDGVRDIAGTHHNVHCHEGDSTSQLDQLIGLGMQFDIIYVDGCHSYEYAKSDYEKALQLLAPTGTIVIDDTVTWWGPRELSEELQQGKVPEGFHFLEVTTTNGLLILRRQSKVKPPVVLTRENSPDGLWHDDKPV